MQETPKPAALARVVDIANQLESSNPNARTLVRDLFAAFTDVMAHFEAAQPIDTLTPEPGTSYLVFSPEQDGWNLGQFGNERWSDAHRPDRILAPSHWLGLPPVPGSIAPEPAKVVEAPTPQPSVSVSLFITRAQKATLRERGFSDEAIKHMKPEEAHRLLHINTIEHGAGPGDEPHSAPHGATAGQAAPSQPGLLHRR